MTDRIKAVIREVAKITAAVGGRDTTPAKWQGKWQPEERYGVLHKVEHLGSSYVCIKACVGVDPEVDVTLGDGVEGQYWILIAKCGEDGAPFTYDMFTEEQLEGLRGPEGPRGYSPTVKATTTSAGVQLTIKNYDEASGTETVTYANVKNGDPGLPGSPGAAGVKGDSCNIQAAETDEGVELTITNTAYTNAGASNNVQKVVVKHGEGAAPETFIATYGETTFAEIEAANAAGKLCFCKYSTRLLPAVIFTSGNIRFAGALSNVSLCVLTVNAFDTWSETTQGLVKKTGDTLTGPLTLSGDPTEDLHAATKAYVDARAGGGGEPEIFIAIYGTTTHGEIKAAFDAGKACFCLNGTTTFGALMLCTAAIARFSYTALTTNTVLDVNASDVWTKTTTALLSKAGGAMSGALTLAADPTEAMQAATKQYVDKKLEENVELMGGAEPEWSKVKNKPFEESGVIKREALPEGYPYKETDVIQGPLNLTWDGNAGDKPLAYDMFYKVTDHTLTNEALKKASATITTNGEVTATIALADLWESSANKGMITEKMAQIAADNGPPIVVVVRDDAEGPDGAGIYFSRLTNVQYVSSLFTTESVDLTKETLYKMDEEFLPEIFPTITTSDNGKFLRVVNGAWAAVALESAEGGSF